MYQNMEAFAKEGVVYLELQSPLAGYEKPDGTPLSLDEAADIFRKRLAAPDARATGVTVRFQTTILRFAPNAEDQLRASFEVADKYRDPLRRREHGGTRGRR